MKKKKKTKKIKNLWTFHEKDTTLVRGMSKTTKIMILKQKIYLTVKINFYLG